MNDLQMEFVELFFDESETVCVSDGKYSYHSISQEMLHGEIVLKSPAKDFDSRSIASSDVNLMSINPIDGFQKDENITSFRSFLIELDEGHPIEQKRYIQQIGMPFSCCVFSGNKSLHFGIVLAQTLPNIETWKYYNSWILNIVQKSDQQMVSPSKRIRFPDNIRHNTGKKQTLLSITKRIDLETLVVWLNEHPEAEPVEEIVTRTPPKTNLSLANLGGVISDMEQQNYRDTGRNHTWFCWAKDVSKYCVAKNIDFDGMVSILENYFMEESDFKYKEWHGILKSAYNSAFRG